MDATLVFQLVALIQQAMRDPRLSPDLYDVGERFLATARDFFADCPLVLDIMRRGPKQVRVADGRRVVGAEFR
jgi:hypothetical protein